MSELGIETNRVAGTVVLCLSGELDIATSARIEQQLSELESAPDGPTTLVIDLRQLSFLDSTGLRLILGAHERAKTQGRKLALIPGPEPVQRVFDLTQLSSRLPFVDDLSDLVSDS